jgi:hypothetical protein
MPSDSSQPQLQPLPRDDSSAPYEVNQSDGSTYFQAPKLFDLRDRAAQRSIAPVRTAVYEQPASYRPISAARARITAEDARQDAIGWIGVSN